jgi:hypothetical protein
MVLSDLFALNLYKVIIFAYCAQLVFWSIEINPMVNYQAESILIT